MWVLIVIILIIFFLFRSRKPAAKQTDKLDIKDPIVNRLYDLIVKADKTTSAKAGEKYKHEYIQIKMLMYFYNDPRFTKLEQAFREGYTLTPPDYIFTEKDHKDAFCHYNQMYHRYHQEFTNMVKLRQLSRVCTHVYIWPLEHRQCEAVKRIKKPKMWPIDEVPRIPCDNCSEPYCSCAYHPAKYR